MKKILITGGAGFIGSHLCERMLVEGHQVVCLDNLFTGRMENIRHLLGNERFSFIQADVTEPYFKYEGVSPIQGRALTPPCQSFPAPSQDSTGTIHTEPTPPFTDLDEIYNLACPASPVHYQYDPIKTALTSVLGALNCLELARRTGAKVLQASTSEVYGDPDVHPQPETYRGNVNPIGPRSCYDEGKRMAETLFFDHYRHYGTRIKVIRIFNTYGPRMATDDGRVISNFIVQALRGEDITIYGDGHQTRSFCYVDDLIEGMIRMMDSEDSFTGPVNLGNPGEFTILELADKVIELTGARSSIVFRPLPQDDPMKRKPDITLARKTLGWKPEVALDEGLVKTVEYFREIT